MAFDQWILNQTPATGSVAMYNYIAMLLASGWTMPNAGDGLAATGANAVTSGAAGANGLGQNSAWVRMQDPAGVRELCIQRATSGSRYWWIRSSKASKFTGGAPNATTAPTAADQQNEWSTTSVGGTLLLPIDGTYRQQGGSDSATYSSYFFVYPTGGGIPSACFVYDHVEQPDAADTDPYVTYVDGTAGSVFTLTYLQTEGATATAPGVKGYVGAAFTCIPANRYASSAGDSFPGSCPANPYSSADDRIAIPFVRRSALANPGYKGKSSMMYWEGITRTTGDTKQGKTRIVAGNVSLPWDGVTVPIL